MLPQALVSLLTRNLPYYQASGGGVTVSGGEPTLQQAFVTEVFRQCHAQGIHTTLDTSGYAEWTPELEALLAETDLVLLDLKDARPNQHKHLCGGELDTVLAFLHACLARKQRLWIRHVLVPEYTLTSDSLQALAHALAPVWHGIEHLDLLPYHRLGEHKWAKLGKHYPLLGVDPVTPQQVAEAYTLFTSTLK
jgi:pyruvate formate lyase activating enzyme